MANEQDQTLRAIADMAKAMGGTIGQAIQDAMAAGARQINPYRDNPEYQPNSIYAPKGVPKARLRRRTFFKGVLQSEAMLTPEEVALFNQIEPGDYRIEVAGVKRLFTVRQTDDGNNVEVKIDFPMTPEERAYMPAMTTILRGMIAGVEAIA